MNPQFDNGNRTHVREVDWIWCRQSMLHAPTHSWVQFNSVQCSWLKSDCALVAFSFSEHVTFDVFSDIDMLFISRDSSKKDDWTIGLRRIWRCCFIFHIYFACAYVYRVIQNKVRFRIERILLHIQITVFYYQKNGPTMRNNGNGNKKVLSVLKWMPLPNWITKY